MQIAAQEDQEYWQALLEAQPATWAGVQQAARTPSGLQPMGLHRGARATTAADYLNVEGVLFTLSRQVVVPNNEQLRTLALAEAHDRQLNGHFGEAKTLEKVRRRWFWDGMTRDVKEYVASYLLCQQHKHSTRRTPGLLHPILAPCPWHTLILDFVGPFETELEGQQAMCLVIIDKFSKYVLLEPVSRMVDAEETAEVFIRRVVGQFGVPSVVISDRGPQFTSRLWQALLKSMGARSALATSHHPQTDGQTERAIQTILCLLRAFIDESEGRWRTLLPLLQYAINDAYCEAIKTTPFRLLYGRDPTSPFGANFHVVDPRALRPNSDSPHTMTQLEEYLSQRVSDMGKVCDFVRLHQQALATRMKERVDRTRRPFNLEAGDLVMLSTRSHPTLRASGKLF